MKNLKKNRLSLDELKVQSFVTTNEKFNPAIVKGGEEPATFLNLCCNIQNSSATLYSDCACFTDFCTNPYYCQ